MPFNSNAPVASSGPVWISAPASGMYNYTKAMVAGTYRIKVYATGLQATPTATISFTNTAGSVIAQAVAVDSVSNDSYNPSEAIIVVPSAAAGVGINTNQAVVVSLEPIGSVSTGAVVNVVSYASSGNITLSTAGKVLLLGGGGSGGGGQSGLDYAGGGGGSGYATVASLAAGTYAAVIGAGGTAVGANATGNTGGTTTMSTYSALGGLGGKSGNTTSIGGAGGSGGGGGGRNSGASTGSGGVNGANGNASTGAIGGVGSNSKLPFWVAYGNGGTVGGGGGVYAGGAGGPNNGGSSGTAGTAAAGGGGGGGSNVDATGGGGAGYAGAIYVAEGI